VQKGGWWSPLVRKLYKKKNKVKKRSGGTGKFLDLEGVSEESILY